MNVAIYSRSHQGILSRRQASINSISEFLNEYDLDMVEPEVEYLIGWPEKNVIWYNNTGIAAEFNDTTMALNDNELEVANFLLEHGELGQAILNNFNNHLGDAQSAIENYAGNWRTKEEFCENLLEDTGMIDQLPTWAQPYFDYAFYVRDLEWGGDYYFIELDGYYHAFSSH